MGEGLTNPTRTLTVKLDNYNRLRISDWDRELFTHDYKKALQLEFTEQTDAYLEDFSSLEKANYFSSMYDKE